MRTQRAGRLSGEGLWGTQGRPLLSSLRDVPGVKGCLWAQAVKPGTSLSAREGKGREERQHKLPEMCQGWWWVGCPHPKVSPGQSSPHQLKTSLTLGIKTS